MKRPWYEWYIFMKTPMKDHYEAQTYYKGFRYIVRLLQNGDRYTLEAVQYTRDFEIMGVPLMLLEYTDEAKALRGWNRAIGHDLDEWHEQGLRVRDKLDVWKMEKLL